MSTKVRIRAAVSTRTVSDRIREKILEARRAKEQEAERQRKLLGRVRLYHFTDARNVPSIREHGGVFSAEQCEKLGINVVAPGGDENSQESDRKNGMDAYVHLCLRSEHPMEYRARTDGRIEKSLFIPVSSEVLEIGGVRFVPGMSNKKGIETYPLEEAVRDEHLDDLDLDALYHWIDWGQNPDVYDRRVRAEKFEIIIPDFIPIDLLKLPNG
jgi:ssDNA thymidine ADP-ribosyltransferase, DarT